MSQDWMLGLLYLAALLAAVFIPVCYARWRGKNPSGQIGSQTVFDYEDGPTQWRLEKLMRNFREKSGVDIDIDVDDIRILAVKNGHKARCYCSMTRIIDLYDGSKRTTWRADIVKSDRFIVTQTIHKEDWFDMWISIGDTHFRGSGLWRQCDADNDDPIIHNMNEINRSFMIENYLEVLENDEVSTMGNFELEGESYVLFEYSKPYSENFAKLLLESDELDSIDAKLSIFVNATKRQIEKVELEIFSKENESDHPMVKKQVFTGFDEDIVVQPPPWLNVNDGKVVAGEIPVVRLHD
jgi:hypothetical protein